MSEKETQVREENYRPTQLKGQHQCCTMTSEQKLSRDQVEDDDEKQLGKKQIPWCGARYPILLQFRKSVSVYVGIFTPVA